MNFGQATTIPELLDAFEVEIASNTGLPRSAVFASLADDSDHLQAPPGDKFIAIRPGKFPTNAGTTASGGRNLTGFDSTWRITCYARLKNDQEFRSGRLLRDTDGPLTLVWRLIKGEQMFTPLDSSGRCLLREPGRLTGFDMDAKKMIGAKETTWTVIPTYWEFKFTADLS